MTLLSTEEVVEALRAKCKEYENLRLASAALGLERDYLSSILNGRAAPGIKVLQAIGVRRRIVYERVSEGEGAS